MFMFILCIIILIIFLIILFIGANFYFTKHNVEYYVINYVYVKNGEINFASDLRFCKAHKCYEERDILNSDEWNPVKIDSNPIRYKEFYFEDQQILNEFKKLKKNFPLKDYHINYQIDSIQSKQFELKF